MNDKKLKLLSKDRVIKILKDIKYVEECQERWEKGDQTLFEPKQLLSYLNDLRNLEQHREAERSLNNEKLILETGIKIDNVPMENIKINKLKEEDIPDELEDLKTLSDSKFRIQNQKLIFTYKSHLPKADFIEWMNTKTRIKAKFIRCAHETGDKSHPYNHTHVLVDYGTAFQTVNVKFFDCEGIHPNIKVIANMEHWKRCLNYIAKEDPENADLKTQPNIAEMIWNCETMNDALKHCKKPSDAIGIIALFNNKPKKILEIEEFERHPWHERILDLIKEPVNKRDVYWIYDKEGCSGKTDLTRHFLLAMPEKVGVLANCGRYADASTWITALLESGWAGDTIVFDLPRGLADRESIYSIIEMFKNGIATSTKYVGKTSVFNRCRTIIFANFLPLVNEQTLSFDRWKIMQIMGKSKNLFDINAQDLYDEQNGTGSFAPF
nr:MAG: replication associated protein [Cressdnaviricota sp.]